MKYLKIEWHNSVDFGSVLYHDGFVNRIYLDVELERPDYEITLEADVNGDNTEINKFKKWAKVYRFTAWMQEDLLDAFTFMSTCDSIEVTPQTGETLIVQPHSMKVEYEWEEAGCLAKATVSFVTDYAAGGSCTENMDSGCLCTESKYTINSVIDYATMIVQPCIAIYYLGYTVEDIANKRYTGKIYTCVGGGSGTWVEQVVSAGDCVEDLAPAQNWYYDATYWHLMPGYIILLINTSGTNVMLLGFAPDGTFSTIYYDTGGGWVEDVTVTSEGFESTPVTIDVGATGNISFRFKVWNHSCDYGYTKTEVINIP